LSPNLAYPAFGALVLAAAAFGVHLGDSAIDQINPIHFQGAAVHPRDRGAAVPDFAAQPQPVGFSQHYGWEEGQAARAADCAGCSGSLAGYGDGGGVAYAVLETGWVSEPQPAVYDPGADPGAEAEAEEAAPRVDKAEVDRYASFQVESEPTEFVFVEE
jgi:hypothetical protein